MLGSRNGCLTLLSSLIMSASCLPSSAIRVSIVANLVWRSAINAWVCSRSFANSAWASATVLRKFWSTWLTPALTPSMAVCTSALKSFWLA